MRSKNINRGRHSVHVVREFLLHNYAELLKDVKLMQRLELIDYIQYTLITQDLGEKEITNIITSKKFKGFNPGNPNATIVNSNTPKDCTCPWSLHLKGCQCGAIKPYNPKLFI